MPHMTHREYVTVERSAALSLAQRVVDGSLDILEGARLILPRLRNAELPDSDKDLQAVALVEDETENLPIGEEAANWSPEVVKAREPDLVRARAWAREVGMTAFENLSRRLRSG